MKTLALHRVTFLLSLVLCQCYAFCAESIDSTQTLNDTVATHLEIKAKPAQARFLRNEEKIQNIKGKINNDPILNRIRRFFATDTAYVFKPKQKMSATLHNQLFLDFLEFYIPHSEDYVYGLSMRSPVRYNIGFSFAYRPFSVSYSLHVNNIANYNLSGIQRTRVHMLNSRFLFDLTFFSDDGKQYVTNYRLGDIKEKYKYKDVSFDGYKFYYVNVQMDWFFNHRKYSASATNSCSSIQKRSAGSFFAGASYSFQNFSADCTLLPDNIQTTFPIKSKINTNSHDFCIDFGYAHNFVFWKKRLTYNITALPRLGVKRFFQNGDGPKYFVALNPSTDMALVYNRSRYFVNLRIHADMLYNLQNKNLLITSLTDYKISVGVRF